MASLDGLRDAVCLVDARRLAIRPACRAKSGGDMGGRQDLTTPRKRQLSSLLPSPVNQKHPSSATSG